MSLSKQELVLPPELKAQRDKKAIQKELCLCILFKEYGMFEKILTQHDYLINAHFEGRGTLLTEHLQFDGDLKLLQILFKYGSDVNRVDLHGNSPLLLAINQGLPDEVLDCILDQKPNVNHRSRSSQYILMQAIRNTRNDRIIRRIVDAGAQVSCRDFNVLSKSTALIAAIESYKAILPKPDQDFDQYKHIKPGTVDDIVKILLLKGADVNGRDEYRRTPLIAIIQENIGELRTLVRLLNDKTVDVNATDGRGNGPLKYALDAVVRSLDGSLVYNVKAYSATYLLLEKGAKISKTELPQLQRVHELACRLHHQQMAQMLMELRAQFRRDEPLDVGSNICTLPAFSPSFRNYEVDAQNLSMAFTSYA